MKIVFTQEELNRELEKLKEGEKIIFYDRPIESIQQQIEFQNYLSKLMMFARYSNIKISGALIFKKILHNYIGVNRI